MHLDAQNSWRLWGWPCLFFFVRETGIFFGHVNTILHFQPAENSLYESNESKGARKVRKATLLFTHKLSHRLIFGHHKIYYILHVRHYNHMIIYSSCVKLCQIEIIWSQCCYNSFYQLRTWLMAFMLHCMTQRQYTCFDL